MSEELGQKGYVHRGGVRGDVAGPFESFNIGGTSLAQLAGDGVVPARDYGSRSRLRPDGLVISRNGGEPRVRLVVEFKRAKALQRESVLDAAVAKLATGYCGPLGCGLGAVSDGEIVRWVAVTPAAPDGRVILREDGYALDAPVDLASEAGCEDVAKTITRIERELDPGTGRLTPPVPVDPTELADRTWQAIWLASGENPERCLASFVEILLFKFLSDLGTLSEGEAGQPATFEHVAGLPPAHALDYYFKVVRSVILRLFPPGEDGTGVIGGLALEPENRDHGRLFAEILAGFEKAGRLRRIDPEFKSRIFERFLKKSISQKSWGQYFTPRNVVKAMVEMSGIEHMPSGEVVADPFCGVGGFPLEPLLHKRMHDFRGELHAALLYRGYDRDPATISLAKANMLIHLSEVLERDPEGSPHWLAKTLNETFVAKGESIAGSLADTPHEQWDLVMTNPPYVVKGTEALRRLLAENAALADYYAVVGSGLENLCLQQVIAGLKRGGRALAIVPDGLLLRHSGEALRRHLLNQCVLEAVVSLPKDTFYSTSKKTYVLAFRRKQDPHEPQRDGVLTYLVGEVGETRDAKRFPIERDDLPAMAAAFRRFDADPKAYSGPEPKERIEDPRARVEPIDAFRPEDHWLVDRWRTEAELLELGDLDRAETISAEDLAPRLREVSGALGGLADLVEEATGFDGPRSFASVSLGDRARFRLSIGRRVLKEDLFGRDAGPVPLYSANVTQPFGHVYDSNIADFSRPSVLWGIDGDFQLAVKQAGAVFATTDHCGRIEILDDRLDASYCRMAIALAHARGFDRTLRPSLRRIAALEIAVPVATDGAPDRASQQALAAVYDSVENSLAEAADQLRSLASLKPEAILG